LAKARATATGRVMDSRRVLVAPLFAKMPKEKGEAGKSRPQIKAERKEQTGPKGRHSIAAAMRPRIVGKLDTEAQRAATGSYRTYGA
jgi:hypothetical protein